MMTTVIASELIWAMLTNQSWVSCQVTEYWPLIGWSEQWQQQLLYLQTITEWSGWHQCCVSMSQVHCHWWCLTPHQSHLFWIKSWRMINYCITCQRRNQCKYKLGKRWNLDCWMFVHEVVYWLTCEQTHCMIILQQSNSRDLCLGSYFEPFTQSLCGDHAAI